MNPLCGGVRTGQHVQNPHLKPVPGLPGVLEKESGGGGYCGYKVVAELVLGNPTMFPVVVNDILEFLATHGDVFTYFASIRRVFYDPDDELMEQTVTYDYYLRQLRRHLESRSNLPTFLWLNDMGLQVVSMIYNINVIVYHMPPGSRGFVSQLIRGTTVKPYSIAMKNFTDSHWTSLLPCPRDNRQRRYPVSRDTLEANVYGADFHQAPQITSQDVISPTVANVSLSNNAYIFQFDDNQISPPRGIFSSTDTPPPTASWEQTFHSATFPHSLPSRTCPGCTYVVKSFRSYCAHLRAKVCPVGEHYVLWRKSTQEKPTQDNKSRSGNNTPQQRNSQQPKNKPLLPFQVFADAVFHQYAPATNFCDVCNVQFKDVLKHWRTKGKSCSKSVLFQQYVPRTARFDRENPIFWRQILDDTDVLSEDSFRQDPSRAATASNEPAGTTPPGSPHGSTTTNATNRSLGSPSSVATTRSVASSTWSAGRRPKQPIYVTHEGKTTKFDPSATHCFCNAGPFKRIATHWSHQNHRKSQTSTKTCQFAQLFQQFVKQRDPFTYVPQYFGDPIADADETFSHNFNFADDVSMDDVQQQSTDNTRHPETSSVPNDLRTPNPIDSPISLRDQNRPNAQSYSSTQGLQNQPAGKDKSPIIVIGDEGEQTYDPNNNFCNACQQTFKKIVQHWTTNKECTKSRVFQNNVPKGTKFTQNVQRWRSNILLGQQATQNQNDIRCPTCANLVENKAEHELKSPSCAAINNDISSSNCTDQTVSDFVLLRESVYKEMTTSEHSFAETRDPTIEAYVINEEDFGREANKHELMPEDQQKTVDDYKQRAHDMNVPEFPWDPKDEAGRQRVHRLFQEAQNTCMDVQYRHCSKCNLKRLRTTVSGLDVCPDCPAEKQKDEQLLTFLVRYRYPDNLKKLSQAEAAVLSYYQPAITVTYSQQDGKRYRLQHLILTKQPDKILRAITKQLPRKKLEDIVNIKTRQGGKDREMVVRTDRMRTWIEYLIENNQFYKEQYRTGQLQVDIEWFESRQQDNINKIPVINVAGTNTPAEDRRAAPPTDNPDSGDDEGSDNETPDDPAFVHLPQNETVGDTNPQTYISLNHDRLYQKANKIDMRRNDVIITEEMVRVPVRDYLGIDFSAVSPNLYPDGQESPCHVRSHTDIKKALAALIHLRVKKTPDGPEERYESEDWYPFEEDVIHAALVFAHAQNQEGKRGKRLTRSSGQC